MSGRFTSDLPVRNVAYISISDYLSETMFHYCFYLVLNGTVKVISEQGLHFLSKKDVFLFCPGQKYQISGTGRNVVLSVQVNRHFLSSQMPVSSRFFCNSAMDSVRDYQPLRNILAQIGDTWYRNDEFSTSRIYALSYSLSYYLCSFHLIRKAESGEAQGNQRYADRNRMIQNYIEENYASHITLESAAQYLHLSSSYLSRYFKTTFYQNFNSYLNQIRLKHAVDELLDQDKSVTDVAFDNGFPSIGAFLKLFREAYGTTPLQYRKKLFREQKREEEEKADARRELSVEKFRGLLADYYAGSEYTSSDVHIPATKKIRIADMQKSQPVVPIWKQLINIGTYYEVLNQNTQKLIGSFQSRSPAVYGRVGEICMMAPSGSKTYFALCNAIRVLLDYGLIPYLNLSVPAEQAFDENGLTLDQSVYQETLLTILRVLCNTFAREEVEKWVFEISPLQNIEKDLREPPERFAARYAQTYRNIRTYLPKAKVGGAAFCSIDTVETYREALDGILASGIFPDFYCMEIIPLERYDASSADRSSPYYYTSDRSYALHKVRQFREILAQRLGEKPQIHVTRLVPDFFQQAYLGDTCFQSTFLFSNIVDLVGEVDLLGHAPLCDNAFAQETDIQFLCSGNGLYNGFGLPKPGALLLEIFCKCQRNLVQKGKNHIVLKGSGSRYMIGLCNYTYISEYERFSLDSPRPISDAYRIYQKPETVNYELHLHNLEPGQYDMLLLQLSPSFGSILDEWARNDYWDTFSSEEIQYLENFLHPKQTHIPKTITDGTLSMQIQLAPHEVAFIGLFLHF